MDSSISFPVNLCNLVIFAFCLYAAGIIRMASSLFPVLMISQALCSPSMHPHSTLVTKWVLVERKDCMDSRHEARSPPFLISIRNFSMQLTLIETFVGTKQITITFANRYYYVDN